MTFRWTVASLLSRGDQTPMGLFLLGAASIEAHVRRRTLALAQDPPTPGLKPRAAGRSSLPPAGHTACHSFRCANASTASRRSRQIVSAASLPRFRAV